MSWADIYPWRRGGAADVRRQAREAILSGALRPGTRLPPTRVLAAELGVARATIVLAYEQLLAEGYLAARAGSGTYVASDLSSVVDAPASPPARSGPAPEPPPRAATYADAFGGAPFADERPFNTGRTLLDAAAQAAWTRAGRRALRAFGPEHLGYGDPCGDPELRALIAAYLAAARGVRCGPEQVIVTSGAQHALDLVIRILLGPGTPVWVEDPGYGWTLQALLAGQAQVHPVPVDREGLVVAEGVAAAPRARAVFVTPSHQYPLGVPLSMARRLELLAWARQTGAWVVEDDYQSEFRYAGAPLTALQGLDGGERVLYVGTFNKAIFPGLRLGYLVAPHALLPALGNARQTIDRQPPTLTQAMVAGFMREGDFAAHVRRRRIAYRAQRDALVGELRAALGDVLEVEAPGQGMHLVAHLKDGRCDIEAERAAAEAGVIVRAVSRLYREAPPRPGLILGFSGFPVAAMRPAVARLAAALRA